MWFLSFLPSTLQHNYSPYIADTLPVLLQGLSDDNDGVRITINAKVLFSVICIDKVREVALRAGHVLVIILGRQCADVILPELCAGMFHDDWRIR
jgi:hypothetical protein